MLVIELRFLAGRYHATPWDHHVNEGLVEWPPSPWRLLRSLISTWYHKASEEVSNDDLRRLVALLAGEQPEFVLPEAQAAHSRHYMPPYRGSTTKVFDAFLDLRDRCVEVIYEQIEIDPTLAQALDTLLDRIGYLGRAESWVEARRLAAPSAGANCVPLERARREGAAGRELVSVLVPWSPDEYEAWREPALRSRREQVLAGERERARQKGKDPGKVKLTKPQEAKLESAFPSDGFASLLVETSDYRGQGWDRPPGTAWVDYVRPVLDVAPPPLPRRRKAAERPTVARYALTGSVLPRITRAVSVGDRIRRALLARSDGAAVFAGHAGDGAPLSGHPHAYVLSETAGSRGRIGHLTVFAPMGFDEDGLRALDGLTSVWADSGGQLRLVLLGIGTPEDMGGPDGSPYLRASRSWRSVTPFVPTRHPKTHRDGRPKVDARGWIGSPRHDLLRLLSEGGYPEPAKVESVERCSWGHRSAPWFSFQTRRARGEGRRAQSGVSGYRLHFDRPVQGPIAIGYGAHFGLGAFVPEG